MNSEEKILAESIRSGKYFEDARGWFHAIYIGPISERSFFLIIALLAGFIAFTSVISLFLLMPITERPPIIVRAGERMDDTVKKLVPLKERQARLNPALVDFFVTQYVKQRESYFASTYLSNARYMQQHSTEDVYANYIAQNDVTNPASPASRLGRHGQRILTIDSAVVDKNTATVTFTTEDVGGENENKTRWTARMEFSYTEMSVSEAKNPDTGEIELLTTDPKFQVVKYELEQK